MWRKDFLFGTVDKFPVTVSQLERTVADVFDGQVTLNVGPDSGARAGMLFTIEKVVREIRNPSKPEEILREAPTPFPTPLTPSKKTGIPIRVVG